MPERWAIVEDAFLAGAELGVAVGLITIAVLVVLAAIRRVFSI